MSVLVDAARFALGASAVFLVVLLGIWGRNYLLFRSKHALGLVVFGVFLLAQSLFALYYYLVDPTLSVWFATAVPAAAWRVLMGVHVLQAVALAVLLWITWD
ncbi:MULTISPECIES: hypothetical protein [Haloferax]|uniref:Uncharacterized protein n=2 Tax=Haloferax TaxID=2251 RepID=A0A0K1ITE6_HALGI|nr:MULTISPECIES: hypothetical protein [Haloferax]AKU07600.1 hypothetical protein ABY42_07530 [Haloferax gibbonsii]ELZ71176.1 hypothetical protein C457_07987 [Haloferax prahovense DSM 18310]QOS11711.1 uncharacterized protein HfgLR_07845 [Haloferax gibbonsii]RDZ45482.1 hypothetical protein C5B86_06945 [Haloferax sp. Atlit-19N]RDZ47243.1 hypothetical protein C5B87_06160 [Haloferax sp. Atlit-16N]